MNMARLQALGIGLRARVALAALVGALAALVAIPALAQGAEYVALGDSYSSGVGTREYFPGSGDCKRGPHAYPVQVAQEIDVPLSFVACSGAETGDVLDDQLGPLDASTTQVTITIGGNDAGFAAVITRCALPWPWTCWGQIDDAQEFIADTLPGLLDEVYGEIAERAPNATVGVLGYPRLFNGVDQCNFGARISPGEQQELNDTADLLADVTGDRAAAHGFAFIDSIPDFVGHAVCDPVEWINGLSNPIGESYHPNRAGHDAFTDLVAPAID